MVSIDAMYPDRHSVETESFQLEGESLLSQINNARTHGHIERANQWVGRTGDVWVCPKVSVRVVTGEVKVKKSMT